MNYFIKKNIGIKYAFLTLMFFVLFPATSQAFFSNGSDAIDSSLTVGTLALSASVSKEAMTVSASSEDSTILNTNNTGSVDAQYQVSVVPVACAANFWNGLTATITKDTVRYQGALADLFATSTSDGSWEVVIKAESTLLATQNETCTFMLSVLSWQNNFADSTDGGFSDTESLTLTVAANEDVGQQPTATVVLNEIYPNPDTASSTPLDVEWIELYNGTDSAVDVAGWAVGELSGVTEDRHILVDDCTGYTLSDHMQPYGTNNTIIAPGGLLVFTFCDSASYLNNTSETISLYASSTSSTTLDSYAYTSTKKGKSIARIPDGSVWVDPVPTPGSPNVATEDELLDAGWSQGEIDGLFDGEAKAEVTEDTVASSTVFEPEQINATTGTSTATTNDITSESKPLPSLVDTLDGATTTEPTSTSTNIEEVIVEEEAGEISPEEVVDKTISDTTPQEVTVVTPETTVLDEPEVIDSEQAKMDEGNQGLENTDPDPSKENDET